MTFNENDAPDTTNTPDAGDDQTVQAPPPPLGTYPAPPPPAPTQAANRLTRDPYATFGGVASGIAYRFGWNVAMVRLAFLATFCITGGAFIAVYLIAWLVLPRALVWPPSSDRAVPARTGGRGLGIVAGLLAIGAVMVALLAIPVAAIVIGAAVIDHDEVNFSFGNGDFRLAVYAPQTLADLPPVIAADEGFVKVNLDNISPAEFEALDEPFELTIELDEGDVLLQVPADLDYSLVAETDRGSVESDGPSGVVIEGETMTVTNADPDINITVALVDGDIELERS